MTLSHLQYLEAESIHIFREVAAEFERPVMLYSVGKDSSVLLRLAQKAFYPARIPFPLLHVDTGFKFPEMYVFRDEYCKKIDANLIIYRNNSVDATQANPFRLGTQKCCSILKTDALLQALRQHNFQSAIGGARRDEEKSRAKERIFSFRDVYGQWEPKKQRPELWNLYNTRINPGESIRVFPLSNWTEMDIWIYIHREKIPVVPLYFAKEREMLVRDRLLIPYVPGMPTFPGEKPQKIMSRFRTLGCTPCTGAIRSHARNAEEILIEMVEFQNSERAGRIIDHDADGSMETKKREGYF